MIKTLRQSDMRKFLERGECFVLWDGVATYCACRWDGHDATPLQDPTSDFDEALGRAEKGECEPSGEGPALV